jgi:hypothetical protein
MAGMFHSFAKYFFPPNFYIGKGNFGGKKFTLQGRLIDFFYPRM